MKKNIYTLFSVLFLLTAGLRINAMTTEEPKYIVIKEYDEFEIRKYSSFIIAETEVISSHEEAGNKAFDILFKFISGNNIKKEEIKMTAPVLQQESDSKGEEIAMTAPVRQVTGSEEEGKYLISFVMPLHYTMESVPVPNDSRITIKEIPGRIMAVRKYSGTWSEKNFNENKTRLLNALRDNKYKITGQTEYARYNPPFWPWFLRRNEVMVEVTVPEPAQSY